MKANMIAYEQVIVFSCERNPVLQYDVTDQNNQNWHTSKHNSADNI